MTPEQMENAIQFLIESQGKFFTDIESLKERQQKTDEQIQALTTSLQSLTDNVEAMRLEMRDAMENLIVANEVTRDLALKVGELAIKTNQRVDKLEEQNEV